MSRMSAAGLCAILIVVAGCLAPSTFAWDRDITVGAVGDLLLFNRVSIYRDPAWIQLVEQLRRPDCTIGNCETTFFAPEDGYPSYKTADPNVFCYPWGADELKWLGIDLVSLANNHIMDFEYQGLFSTLENLQRTDIVCAGAGKDLNQAARPGYFETEAGSVALVAFSSWIPEKNHQASLPGPLMAGKPGLNPLNVNWVLQLDAEHFAQLKAFRDSLWKGAGEPLPKEEAGKEVTTLDLIEQKFVKGDTIDFLPEPNQRDVERIKEAIGIARRNARLVVVMQHEHGGKIDGPAPSKPQEELARAFIDAGADIYICTGPHELWGIEIYKTKPIFYSLGNFFFQGPLRIISPEAYARVGMPVDSKDPIPYEEKFDQYFTEVPLWDGVVPLLTFDKENKVREIRLQPIDLHGEKPIFLRGTPRIPDEAKSKSIIERLIKMSEPYKTRIVYEKGVGKILL